MGSSVGDNGVYKYWSPYFVWSDRQSFELSKDLPLPNGKTYTTSDEGMDISEYNYLENAYNNDQTYTFLTGLNKLLEATKDVDTISTNTTPFLLRVLNNHNRFNYDTQEATKNKIFHDMFKIGASPVNFIAENTVLTIQPARDAAEQSTSGQFGQMSSNDNPGAKMVSQLQNSVGKVSIGVYANGIKAFASLLGFYKEGFNRALLAYNGLTNLCRELADKYSIEINPNYDVIQQVKEEITRRLPEVDPGRINECVITGESYFPGTEGNTDIDTYIQFLRLEREADLNKYKLNRTVVDSNGNAVQRKALTVYDNNGNSFTLKQAMTLPNLDLFEMTSDNPMFNEIINNIKSGKIQEDVFEILGIMLNVSTDNAKELVLEKINASGDMAKIYIYMITTGIPFKDITKFMTTDIVTLVTDKSQKSIVNLEDKSMDLDHAIAYYLEGVNLNNYVGKDYVAATLSAFRLIDNKIPSNFNEFTSYINNLPVDQLNALADKVYTNRNKFNISGAVVNQSIADEIGEEEMTDYLRSFDRIDVSFLVSRYLAEVKKRRLQLDKIKGNVEENLNVLDFLNKGGKEITEYSQWCGINQGLRTLREDSFNFIQRRENFISKMTGQPFSLIQFFLDENYRKEQIALYEDVKVTFNILDAITQSPHFNKMYDALVTNEQILSAFSFKHRTYNDLGYALIRKRIVNSLDLKTGRIIRKFVDDVVLNNFLDNYSFSLDLTNEGDLPFYMLDGTIKEQIGVLSLNDPYNRASFKNIMEHHIIPKLQKIYPDNKFIRSLMMDYRATPFGFMSFMKLPIDLNNSEGDTNETLINSYINGFNQIRKDTFAGRPIEDLFFLYNLLINNNSFGPKTITRIFGDAVREMRPGSAIEAYANYESSLSTMEIPFNIEDLYMRFAGQDNSGYTKRLSDGNVVISDSKGDIQIFTENNSTILPFTDKIAISFNKQTNDLYRKLIDLITSGKAIVKLTCDE